MGSWEAFIDNLKDEAGKLSKDELKGLVKGAKSDSEDFIKRQGRKIERYLNQLAGGKITKDQFESYITDIRDLTTMEALKLSVEAKARAQRLIIGLCNLLIEGLLGLL